ncbi:hypothetical protein GCM10023149_48420 [Mucilaginibacter gynuensis]|uniref:Uncharacterized protein n=1 Tax=Mucilaginibacter gynuensis TaxID=1302236 RepID=A0ABP8HFK3_9SPHI
MSAASGLYSIDGQDWFDTYGFAVASGSDDFLKFPERKPPPSKSWDDEHGIDVDLTEPFFKEKEISIGGAIFAQNEDDFWLKYKAMFTMLSKPGTRRMYVNELGRSFYIYYQACTAFTRLTRIKNDNRGKVRCDYTLKFIEPIPSFWKQFKYLTDKDGNYIVTKQNNKILIP